MRDTKKNGVYFIAAVFLGGERGLNPRYGFIVDTIR